MKNVSRVLGAALLLIVSVFMSDDVAVSAASIPASAITIDYDRQTLTVKEGSNPDLQIYYGVPKIKTVKQKNANGVVEKKSVLVTSAWEVYDYNTKTGTTIDLSNLNRTRDNYIQLKGSKAKDTVTIKIPAVLTKVSASFDVTSATVTMKDTTDRKNPVPITGKAMEYKVANSNWNAYTDADLSIYQVRGATLSFRLAADKKAAIAASALTPLTGFADSAGNAVSAYVVGSFPGKEVKVSIKKQAAAPSVKVDYNRQQFVLPKNTEYRVVTDSKLNAWTPASTTAVKYLNLSEISGLLTGKTSATLEVRTAATGAKVASKVRKVDFDMPQAAPEVCSSKSIKPSQIIDADILTLALGTDWEDDVLLDAGYQYARTTKVFQGVRFYNTSPNTYEVYVSKDGKAPMASSTGLFTVKAKSSTAKKDAETFIATKYIKNGDKVYIRKKADTKKKVFASEFAPFGTVNYQPD